MSEGGVYLSAWSLELGVYTLRLKGNPQLSATDTDFDTAADELASLVGAWNGDGEAVLEFPSGRPGDRGPGILWHLRALGYNESVRATNRDSSQFEGGICDHCSFGIGRRTTKPLEVDSAPRGHVASVDRTLPRALIVSEEFVQRLAPDEVSRVRIQPVITPGRRTFLELVGDPVGHTVGISGAEYREAFLQSWQCRVCDRRNFVVDHIEYPTGSLFLASSSLRLPPPSLFVFDEGSRLALAATPERWEELSSDAVTRGFTSGALFVVDAHVAEPFPMLPEPKEFDWVL